MRTLTTVTGPDDLATAPDLLAAWPTDNYGSVPGRADVGGVDTLSCEGPHRSLWRLTGYARVGTIPTGTTIYVLRVSVNDSSRVEFVAATVYPSGAVMMHAADYEPEPRTLTRARARAAELQDTAS